MSQLEWKDWIGPGGVLLASIITQVVTVALLIANNRMAYKRSRREKLWDLKRDLYSKVIAKVGEIKSDDTEARKRASESEYQTFPKIMQAQDLFCDNYLIFSRALLEKFEPINGNNLWRI